MSGPEHYREAERLLMQVRREMERATANTITEVLGVADGAYRQAQVHATLALAAATMDVAGATVNGVVSTGWSEALS